MSRRNTFLMVLFAGVVGFAPAATAAPPTVAQLLTSASPAQVAVGLRQLAGTPAPGLEDALYVAAQRPEAELSSAALDLLSQTGDTRAVELLEAAIRSLDPSRVSVACVWLPRFGALGLDAAERLLDDPDPVVRRAMGRTLAWFPPSPEVQALIERVAVATRPDGSRVADGARRR
ncbi:MAG: hypothetical protein CVT68_06125 [Actinobacteria bacterium HGW-Actinobacteria-8]|jgi:HEAT repeat protein|nr:MAG: hypothetical protein CVT68_06125 [Actinobacteria bacterium HGW-Actinobacteria-8]